MAYLPHPFPQSKFTLTFFLFSFSFSFNGFFAPHVEPLFFILLFFSLFKSFSGLLEQSLQFFFFFPILFVGSFILCSLLWTILSFSFLYKIITWKGYALGHESKFIQTLFSVPPLFHPPIKYKLGKLKSFLFLSRFLFSYFSIISYMIKLLNYYRFKQLK